MLIRQTCEAMIATHVTITAAGSTAPVAAMASASLVSAKVGVLTHATVTPAKRHDKRGRV